MQTEDLRPKTFAEITQDHILDWKQKGRENLREISVPLDDDILDDDHTAKFIICSPSRPVLNSATKYSAEKDFDRANKVLIQNCLLGGDFQHLNVLRIELAVLEKIGQTLDTKSTKVKKL
jgi:hypothetical protein